MRTSFYLVISLMFLGILLTGCGGGGGSGSANPVAPTTSAAGIIRGQISGDGEVANVPIYLVNAAANVLPDIALRASQTEQGALRVTVTDSAGCFVFESVPEGTYNLIAQKSQFSSAIMRNVSVRAQGETVSPLDLVLKLTATGDITGNISVPGGFPRSGVIAFVTGTSFAAFTDANGNYLISGVPVGEHNMAFIGHGLAQQSRAGIKVEAGVKTSVPAVELAALSPQSGSFVWKGQLDAAPENPEVNWAYYHAIERKTYIWNGAKWDLMMDNSGDITSPQLSNVEINQTSPSIIEVKFSANEPCNFRIDYGATTSYGKEYLFTERYDQYFWSALDSTGLSIVNFRITLTDLAGNITTSQNYTVSVNNAVLSISDVVATPDILAANLSFKTSEKPASCVIEWGVKPTYTNQIGLEFVAQTDFSHQLVGLSPGTEYSYKIRVFAGNGYETAYAGTFTTGTEFTDPIILGFNIESGESPDSVTISWQADRPVQAKVHFGESTSYSDTVFGDSLNYGSDGTIAVNGLAIGRTYNFMLEVVSQAAKVAQSGNQTYTVPLPKPTILYVNTHAAGVLDATINWTVDGSVSVTRTGINWGTTQSYGNVVELTSDSLTGSELSFWQTISGLESETTYHYQVWATNAAGTTFSEDYTFTTGAISYDFTVKVNNVEIEQIEEGKSLNLELQSTVVSFKRVRFYRDSIMLAEIWGNSGYFSYSWRNITAGTHQLYAVMTDFNDNQIETPRKTVTVTEVSGIGGEINTDTTWTKAGSPYRLLSNITVTGNANLTIESGAVIRSDNGSRIILRDNANLSALAAANDPISFEDVRISSESGFGSIRLSYVDNCPEINVFGSGLISLEYSSVASIVSNSSNIAIRNCNLGYAHFNGSAIVFEANSVKYSLYINSPDLSGFSITGNWFNNETFINLYGLSGVLDLSGNYWSTTDQSIIESRVVDINGAPIMPISNVVINNFLLEAPVGLVPPSTLPFGI